MANADEPGTGPAPTIDRTALLPAPWRVRRAIRETDDVTTLELVPRGAELSATPAPGQFLMLYAFGIGEVPISVAGRTATGGILHTIRDVGAVTHALCRMGPGDVVGVRGPFGTGWDLTAARHRDVVVVAGGIGLAPLRQLVENLAADRQGFGRVLLAYGARQPADLLYAADRARWQATGIQVEVTVDHADHAWDGHVGVVTPLVRTAEFDPDHAFAWVCGPELMMAFVARELVARGVASDHIEVSLERNMRCGVGLCGHCQLGDRILCTRGPVLPWNRAEPLLSVTEL